MRLVRLASTGLLACSSFVVLACGDDTETATSSGGGGATSSSSDATTATGSTSVTATAASGGGEGGEGGEGGATGSGGDTGTGGAGGSELEVVEGPGFRSGSRLRPVYLDGGDGARQLLHWYDRELQLPCRFMEATASGETYTCLPFGHGGARIAFADDACTEPVMVITSDNACGDRFASTSTDYEVVLANTSSQIGRGTRTTYERGEVLDPQPPVYEKGYEGFDPTCAVASLEEGEVVHAASAPVIPLVVATRELESLGDGLARAIALGDDGSMELMGPFEEESATPCQYLLNRTSEAGGATCAPAVVAEFASPTMYFGNIHYSDDACSVPAASVLLGELPANLPDYVVGPSEIEGELVAYERGELLDVAYGTFTGECAEHATTSDHYALGAPLDRSFAHVFWIPFAVARLGTLGETSAAGELARIPWSFADPELEDTGCSPAVFASENADGDAPMRCVPGARGNPFNDIPSVSDDYFANAACTQPLVEGFPGVVAIDRRDVPDGDACSAGRIVYDEVSRAARFERYEGDVYYRQGGACLLRDPDLGPAFSRYVGDLEPEDFVILTLVDPATDGP